MYKYNGYYGQICHKKGGRETILNHPEPPNLKTHSFLDTDHKYCFLSRKVKEFAQSHESREANIEYLEKEMMKSRLYNEKRMEELVNRSPLESYTKPFGSTPDK